MAGGGRRRPGLAGAVGRGRGGSTSTPASSCWSSPCSASGPSFSSASEPPLPALALRLRRADRARGRAVSLQRLSHRLQSRQRLDLFPVAGRGDDQRRHRRHRTPGLPGARQDGARPAPHPACHLPPRSARHSNHPTSALRRPAVPSPYPALNTDFPAPPHAPHYHARSRHPHRRPSAHRRRSGRRPRHQGLVLGADVARDRGDSQRPRSRRTPGPTRNGSAASAPPSTPSAPSAPSSTRSKSKCQSTRSWCATS